MYRAKKLKNKKRTPGKKRGEFQKIDGSAGKAFLTSTSHNTQKNGRLSTVTESLGGGGTEAPPRSGVVFLLDRSW